MHPAHQRGGLRSADIKAPDGFTLGGLRKVRKDGTILFGRGWWKVPDEWIGEDVWVHVADCYGIELDVAPPGMHIHEALLNHRELVVRPDRTDRRDAKPCFRTSDHKAWTSRNDA
jgi:hypothetical protein